MHTHSAPLLFPRRSPLPPATPDRIGLCRCDEIDLGSARLSRIGENGLAAESETGGCVVIFQTSAWASLSGKRRSLRLQAGTWFVGPTDLLEIELPCGSEALSIVFPLEHLSRSLALQVQAQALAALPTSGASNMCLEFSQSCLSFSAPMDRNVAVALGDCLIELAKLAIIEQLCTRRDETVRETVRTRIQSFVQRNIHDPDLTIERIAERLGCTKRYLHKVFSNEGQTLSQYIWAQRLERCRSELGRPEMAAKSITEIAFNGGFSDTAHFSRSFRSRFGQAPRAYRRAMLEARIWGGHIRVEEDGARRAL